MRPTSVVFLLVVAFGVSYAAYAENGQYMELTPAEQLEEIEAENQQMVAVEPVHPRQKRFLLGAGLVGAGLLGAGALGAGAIGAGIIGAKVVGAGVVGGALAAKALHSGRSYGGYGYGYGYRPYYYNHYPTTYIVDDYW